MILIRCDAGATYGLGHVSRMLAVAVELVRLGHAVTFLTRTPALGQWTASQGSGAITVRCVTTRNYSEGDMMLDQVTHDGEIDVMVVDRKDTYEATAFRKLREWVKIVRIDHPEASEETADLLVIPNMHQPPEVVERLHEDFGERLLIGADYTIINSAASPWRETRDPTIVFFAGGSDPNDLLLDMYSATYDLRIPGVQKIFMFGTLSGKIEMDVPDRNIIVTGFNSRTLARASLAIGHLGVTAYEAMHMGTPLLVFPGIQSDQDGVRALEESTEEAVVALSDTWQIDRTEVCRTMKAIWEDLPLRLRMGRQTMQMIDGQGARRVAEAIARLIR